GCFRLGLLPGLGLDRVRSLAPPGLAPHPPGLGVVAAGRQPARMHLLRHLRRRGIRRSVEGLDAGPRRRQLEHVLGSYLLPGLRARHTAQWTDAQGASISPTPLARACRRTRHPRANLTLGMGATTERQAGATG